MCFAPQWRAPFRHINFQKWCALYILSWTCASRHNGVRFFDISTSKSGPRPSVLNNFATTACTFDISTSKSGPNLVCFVHFDFDMCFAPQRGARWLRTCRFSDPGEPTFRPSGATNHWKTQWLATFLPLRTCIFFLLNLSPLWSSPFSSPPWLFPPLLFHLSMLSEVWLLNFLRS